MTRESSRSLTLETPVGVLAVFSHTATLLAYAGLKRLNMAHVATSVLDQDVRLHGIKLKGMGWDEMA